MPGLTIEESLKRCDALMDKTGRGPDLKDGKYRSDLWLHCDQRWLAALVAVAEKTLMEDAT